MNITAVSIALVTSQAQNASLAGALDWADSFVAAAKAREPSVGLVVFPEFALQPPKFTSKCSTPLASLNSSFCPRIRPARSPLADCSSAARDDLETRLSCAARSANAWLSVNACDGQPEGAYNAQLIFDASGTLVAKYYKTNPWFKKCFLKPSEPDVVVVNMTSLTGVTPSEFGVFTCFDIVNKEPAASLLKRGVRTFLYSSANVPGLVKTAWSLDHNATLLNADAGSSAVSGPGVYVRGRRQATAYKDRSLQIVRLDLDAAGHPIDSRAAANVTEDGVGAPAAGWSSDDAWAAMVHGT